MALSLLLFSPHVQIYTKFPCIFAIYSNKKSLSVLLRSFEIMYQSSSEGRPTFGSEFGQRLGAIILFIPLIFSRRSGQLLTTVRPAVFLRPFKRMYKSSSDGRSTFGPAVGWNKFQFPVRKKSYPPLLSHYACFKSKHNSICESTF